jgi:drug/metabolite transporter (DMT)-like permease
MDWFIYAIMAALFYAIEKVYAKRFLGKKVDAIKFTAYHDLIVGLMLLPIAAIAGFKLPSSVWSWALFCVAAISYWYGDLYTYKSLNKIDVSLSQIITQLRLVLVLMGGVLFFSESFSLLKALAILLIIAGAVVVSYRKGYINKDFSKGVLYSTLGAASLAVGFLIDKNLLSGFGIVSYASLVMIACGLFGLTQVSLNKDRTKQDAVFWKMVLVCSILFAGFRAFLSAAIFSGEVSRAVPVSQASVIFSVIGGMVLLGEREEISKRVAGLFLIILGISLLYAF